MVKIYIFLDVLKNANLAKTSTKKVIQQLEKVFDTDLSEKKKIIDQLVMDYVTSKEKEKEDDDDDDDEEDEEEEEEVSWFLLPLYITVYFFNVCLLYLLVGQSIFIVK